MDGTASLSTFWDSLHEKRWLYWLPVFTYAGLIFYFSSLPYPTKELPSWFGQFNDKLIHVVEYGVLGVLLYRALRWGAGPRVAAHAVWCAIIGAALYGMTDEVHQAFVPPREADMVDVLADTIGSILTVFIWRRVTEP